MPIRFRYVSLPAVRLLCYAENTYLLYLTNFLYLNIINSEKWKFSLYCILVFVVLVFACDFTAALENCSPVSLYYFGLPGLPPTLKSATACLSGNQPPPHLSMCVCARIDHGGGGVRPLSLFRECTLHVILLEPRDHHEVLTSTNLSGFELKKDGWMVWLVLF